MEELKPCPHCGTGIDLHEVQYPNGETGYRVSVNGFVSGCYICTNVNDIEPDDLDCFIEAWNARAGKTCEQTRMDGECIWLMD